MSYTKRFLEKRNIETDKYIIRQYPLNIEQISFFKKRQLQHENRVKTNAKRLAINFPHIAKQLLTDVENHDKSKWQSEEYFAYVWLTSVMNLDYEYPTKELEQYVNSKWTHHYQTNPHHPEYWIDLYNNISKMPEEQLAHMVCDWASMSQELGTSLIEWYKNKALKKYKFSNTQQQTIETFLKIFIELN